MVHRVIAGSFLMVFAMVSLASAQSGDSVSRDLSGTQMMERSETLRAGIEADIAAIAEMLANVADSGDEELEGCVSREYASANGASRAATEHHQALGRLVQSGTADADEMAHELDLVEIVRQQVANHRVRAAACTGEDARFTGDTERTTDIEESFPDAGAAGPGDNFPDDDDFVEDRTPEATPFF